MCIRDSILHGTVADPLVVEIDGRGQVIVGQSDGWLRSFDALTGELIWKFDANKKESKWGAPSGIARCTIMTTPVYYRGRVYLGVGREWIDGKGQGRLLCIDPKRKGDISSELAVDANKKLIPHRRIQAVASANGEKAIPNPNSGLIWEYTSVDQNKNDKLEWHESFHCTMSDVVVKDNLLVAADHSGLVHCFDVDTGKQHWVYDALNEIVATPLIVEDIVYVACTNGRMLIFRLSSDPQKAMKTNQEGKLIPFAEVDVPGVNYSSPIFANGVLYFVAGNYLWAIANDQ